jgi:hypothetical protein
MTIQPLKYQLGIKSTKLLYSYHPEIFNIWSHIFPVNIISNIS